MLILSARKNLYFNLLAIFLMVITRSDHSIYAQYLPDASYAIFFLLGIYLQTPRFFFTYCGLAVIIDWAAINIGGVSSFCVTPAYIMLLPSYAVLWLAGRWYNKRQYQFGPLACVYFFLAAIVSALIAELISSASFYFLGGRFDEPTWQFFVPYLIKYFPYTLKIMMLYIGVAGLVRAGLYFFGQSYKRQKVLRS